MYMHTHNIPFRAALFDLDGTLLDSMFVWREVDRQFFEARGIQLPKDYGRAIQGMSFQEAAEYTIRRFELDEGVDAVMDEWMRRSREEYAHHVALKKGALGYLRALRRAGVKLAVATANRAELFEPVLRRAGALELFDALCTSAEVGGGNKSDGALFALAAERLGVPVGECAVFEDTWEGVCGAKRLGMRAYCVRDAGFAHYEDEIMALADGVIDDFDQMGRIHPLPEPRRCVIFTSKCEGSPERAYSSMTGDYILCADGGWELARRLGARPDCVIGDFDSSEEPAGERTVRVPVEKDDTDTMLCLKKGLEMGYEDFLIVGGFGGRFDHTLANIQTLHYAANHGARAEMRDGERWAAAVRNGAIRVQRTAGDGVKLSVFALSDVCEGVSIRGTKYAVEGATLTNGFPLGVSNSFASEFAEISVESGTLLATLCGDL